MSCLYETYVSILKISVPVTLVGVPRRLTTDFQDGF